MSLEWGPLPAEALPPGWYVGAVAPDRLAYRCEDLDLTLEAVRADPEETNPVLGVTRCWELRLCYSIGEFTVTDRLARESTRRELQSELHSCLEFLQDSLAEVTDPITALRAFRTCMSS